MSTLGTALGTYIKIKSPIYLRNCDYFQSLLNWWLKWAMKSFQFSDNSTKVL